MNYLIKNIQVVNEGKTLVNDVYIKDGRIDKIDGNISVKEKITIVDGERKWLLPGMIDDQVHFREPGLTHKATIFTESKAAVAGGVTSFMEMPNTVPPAFTQQLLEEKYAVASQTSLANYSFYMGTSNDNAEEVLRTNEKKKEVCGVKIFMGSSTGNLLVDNPLILEKLFANLDLLIATHCEDERIIKANLERIKASKLLLQPSDHPIIRDEEACFESSFRAVQMAMKNDTRLHVLHITTEKELQLFGNMLPLKDKRITAEVCVHHLHFTAGDYAQYGNLIKCNPAIKAAHNRDGLWKGLLDDRLDVIATDHAPHLLSEKGWLRSEDATLSPLGRDGEGQAHAGLPLVQHPLLLMLHYVKQGKITIEKMVEKMSHAVADCFNIENRGYIREGYFADLVIVDQNKTTTVRPANILYKCGWSPLEGFTFPAAITHTFVNGNMVYGNGGWDESYRGMRLRFER